MLRDQRNNESLAERRVCCEEKIKNKGLLTEEAHNTENENETLLYVKETKNRKCYGLYKEGGRKKLTIKSNQVQGMLITGRYSCCACGLLQ